MTTFFETLLGGLALAAVTAVTFVAYKHPKTYARVYNVMSMGLLAIFVLWMVFDVGQIVGHYQANEAVRNLNKGLVETASFKSLGWKYAVWPACSFYLLLLSFFPAIFKDEMASNKTTPNKTTNDKGS